jgi:CDP-glucose 4,6-dehydratase
MKAYSLNDLSNVFENKKVFITGHTGFKGGWLSSILHLCGAHLYGYALKPPTVPSFYEEVGLSEYFQKEWIDDIRDYAKLSQALLAVDPDIIIHLAAQPLVRASYESPIETIETNVLGTSNLLDAARKLTKLKSMLIITTDKCYENKEWAWGYREGDQLGGHDIYSSSKACTELITTSFIRSFFNKPTSPRIATARAGNVIGGGDWAKDRLVPDIIKGLKSTGVHLRSPYSVRPWQHVLEPLSGYLSLIIALLNDTERKYEGAWNFGPDDIDVRTVEDLTRLMAQEMNSDNWSAQRLAKDEPHETTLLKLDSSKAKLYLPWKPKLRLEECVRFTAEWYQLWETDAEAIRGFTKTQIQSYFNAT